MAANILVGGWFGEGSHWGLGGVRRSRTESEEEPGAGRSEFIAEWKKLPVGKAEVGAVKEVFHAEDWAGGRPRFKREEWKRRSNHEAVGGGGGYPSTACAEKRWRGVPETGGGCQGREVRHMANLREAGDNQPREEMTMQIPDGLKSHEKRKWEI
ncbi:hypothetical protein BC829DRAFT_417403 [Chytridium lagenaria]|nr:hypothetical protein BC829DRAFT_417403 [Chytridium lagenaria]